MDLRRKKNIVRSLLILAAGVALSWLVILFGPEPERGEPEPPPPHVAEVIRVELAERPIQVDSQGTVTAGTATEVVAQVGGEVVRVADYFDAGGYFQAGEVLLEIDPRDYEIALARARSTLAEARKVLAQERGQARQARREWRDLGDPDANALFLRKPQIEAAEAAVEAAEAGVRQAEIDLERTRVSLPFDGRVVAVEADLGEYLARGGSIARVYATDAMEVRLPLTANDMRLLNLQESSRRGSIDPLEVQLEFRMGDESVTWQGRVVRVEAEVNRESRLFHVVAEIDGAAGEGSAGPAPAPGMFVEALITSNPYAGVALLPRSALYRRSEVMVLDDRDRLQLATVDLLQVEDDHVAVRGLAAGQRVLVQPPGFMELGAVYQTVAADAGDASEALDPLRDGYGGAADKAGVSSGASGSGAHP